ncbi:unnamed protein product [Microthlaspi erraticum]|uniref:Uncharacterized protein n=1 Tax=Microthlaspi erraticum TaxID=1685480 RepID=A0A6D2KJM4_9BRAS|nr:unnamed protein product [Microthlaspi erraticum]
MLVEATTGFFLYRKSRLLASFSSSSIALTNSIPPSRYRLPNTISNLRSDARHGSRVAVSASSLLHQFLGFSISSSNGVRLHFSVYDKYLYALDRKMENAWTYSRFSLIRSCCKANGDDKDNTEHCSAGEVESELEDERVVKRKVNIDLVATPCKRERLSRGSKEGLKDPPNQEQRNLISLQQMEW